MKDVTAKYDIVVTKCGKLLSALPVFFECVILNSYKHYAKSRNIIITHIMRLFMNRGAKLQKISGIAVFCWRINVRSEYGKKPKARLLMGYAFGFNAGIMMG